MPVNFATTTAIHLLHKHRLACKYLKHMNIVESITYMEYSLELKCRNSWIPGICLFRSGKLSKGILFAQLYLSLFLDEVSPLLQKIKNIAICIFKCKVTFSWKKNTSSGSDSKPNPYANQDQDTKFNYKSGSGLLHANIVDIVSSLTGYGSGSGSATRPLNYNRAVFWYTEKPPLVIWHFIIAKKYEKYIDFI